MAVAEVVEPDVGKPGALEEGVPPRGQGVGVPGSPVASVQHLRQRQLPQDHVYALARADVRPTAVNFPSTEPLEDTTEMYRDRGLKVRTGSMLLLACIIIACFAYTTLDASAAAQPGLLWVARFNDPMDKNDSPCCVASSPDGTEVYVAGATPLGSVLLSYDSATGLRKWTSRLDGTPVASVVAPDGSMVLVTGGANAGNYITAAFDSLSGARLWESIFDAGPASEDIASDLVVSSDGLHVVVTGTSGVDHPSSDIVTISYDALTGQRDWVERFDGSSHQYDSGVALASSPSAGDVFVTGFTQSGSGVETRDFVTLKYDVSGTQVWEAQFDGSASGEDSAAAIAVSPDGSRVFVTGRSQGLTDGNFDMGCGIRWAGGQLRRCPRGSNGRRRWPGGVCRGRQRGFGHFFRHHDPTLRR